MKICSIVGTRPQLIKYIPMKKALQNDETILIHTGQHYDKSMSDIFITTEPEYNLHIKAKTQAGQLAKPLIRLEQILKREKPDVVLTYGDCNSTLSGALVTAKLNIPLGHIQAGVRSFDKTMPEEINRIIADHCSDFLFCPTDNAMNNLRKEGLGSKSYYTGDLMLEALLDNKEAIKPCIIPFPFYLATIHRPSNTDKKEKLKNILNALNIMDKIVIFPMHPRTVKRIEQWNIKIGASITIIKPVDYFTMISLEMAADKIITDSGGVLCEAYFLKKPCVCIRDNSEFPEIFKNDGYILSPNTVDDITNNIQKVKYSMNDISIFGDGHTAEKIVRILKRRMNE